MLQADRLKLGYAKLEAPITGRVGAIRVTPGNLVGVNDADRPGDDHPDPAHPRRLHAARARSGCLAQGVRGVPPAAVRVYTPGSSTPLATGALDFVDSSVDPTSGTIAAKAKFANDNLELWPGMYVDVEIDLDVRPKTVMIPAVAIQSGQKGPFVFVAKDDQTVEMRNVELVGIEGDRAALTSGVTDGRAGHRRGPDAPGQRRARRREPPPTAAARSATSAKDRQSSAADGKAAQ